MLPGLAGPAGTEIHMEEAVEQVVELLRAPTSAGCCCSGAVKMSIGTVSDGGSFSESDGEGVGLRNCA
jgi:hypothetical protein